MTEKRYSLLYGIDENPYEWDIIDNEKNSIIYQSNGIAICNELNELNDENNELKSKIKDLEFENEKKYRTIMQLEQMLQDVER